MCWLDAPYGLGQLLGFNWKNPKMRNVYQIFWWYCVDFEFWNALFSFYDFTCRSGQSDCYCVSRGIALRLPVTFTKGYNKTICRQHQRFCKLWTLIVSWYLVSFWLFLSTWVHNSATKAAEGSKLSRAPTSSCHWCIFGKSWAFGPAKAPIYFLRDWQLIVQGKRNNQYIIRYNVQDSGHAEYHDVGPVDCTFLVFSPQFSDFSRCSTGFSKNQFKVYCNFLILEIDGLILK